MHTVTVFVDGQGNASATFLDELRAALVGLDINLMCPVVPGKPTVTALLRRAQHTVTEADSADNDEYGPSDALLSQMASAELLQMARLTLAAVQRAWCSGARSSLHRIRLNLCTESELFVAMELTQSADVSNECKTLVRELVGAPYGSAPLLHLYAGPTEHGEAYLHAATEAGVRARVVTSVAEAAAAIRAFLEPLFPRRVDPAEFL
tara:strand:+ start:1680 stop:2300 length:621 start_codon:yes stop_codon:yes gene_type:complete